MQPRTQVAPDSDEARQILAAIDRWLEREVAPNVMQLEHDDVWPERMVRQMQELGLFGATISPQYGGLGLSAQLYARIVARISEVWMSLTGIFNSHLIMAAAVARFGTEEQKRRFLPRFASGEVRGGLALTEPDCGTDLQAIRTRAVKQGDHYVINGTKTWISNGIKGSCFALLVKTDPTAQPRHKGMTMFLAEKGPGFRVSKKLENEISTCRVSRMREMSCVASRESPPIREKSSRRPTRSTSSTWAQSPATTSSTGVRGAT